MSYEIQLLIPLSLLVGCLCFQHIKRERERRRAEREFAAKWGGKAIDISPLKPAIENLRRDYAAARPATRGISFHRALLALARDTIGRLPFFQHNERAHDQNSQAR
jgi:hypothetical protein